MQTIKAVKCVECGKLHEVESDTYVICKGIFIGQNSGILNELDNVFCKECFVRFVQDSIGIEVAQR